MEIDERALHCQVATMIYEYQCSCGNKWERLCSLKDKETPSYCQCGKEGERLISAVPFFFRRTHPDVKQDMHELVAGESGNYTEI